MGEVVGVEPIWGVAWHPHSLLLYTAGGDGTVARSVGNHKVI